MSNNSVSAWHKDKKTHYRATNITLGMSLILLVLFTTSESMAAGAIRTEQSLKSALKRIQSKNVKTRIKLAKLMKKKGDPWDLWLELSRVQRLAPKNSYAKKYCPKFPPEQPKEEDPGIKQARLQANKKCIERLLELIERGEKGKLKNEELKPVALAILSFNTNHSQARKILGFTGKDFHWVAKSIQTRMSAVAAAGKKVETAKVISRQFKNLESALGGKFTVYKTKHAFYVTKNVSAAAIIKLSRAAETAFEVFHHDFFGQSDIFEKSDRETTGVNLKKFIPPVFLVLDNPSDHKRFLAKVVSDANLKVVGKSLAFVSTNFPPDRITIFESRVGTVNIEEWGALMMTHFSLGQRFKMKKPVYLKNGIGHYYAGLVSGQARLAVVGKGTISDSDRKKLARGDFFQLRWNGRWAHENFRAPLPAEFGLRKTVNGMNGGDVGIATAFAEFLIEHHRSKLISFIQESQESKENADQIFAKVFGEERGLLHEKFLPWFVENY